MHILAGEPEAAILYMNKIMDTIDLAASCRRLPKLQAHEFYVMIIFAILQLLRKEYTQ